MKNFEEFAKKYPETAQSLKEMTKEEILEHYALEVAEKDDLAEFKETYDDYQTDLECIVNSAKTWLVKNRKDKHHLHISKDKIQLIYTNVETQWI